MTNKRILILYLACLLCLTSFYATAQDQEKRVGLSGYWKFTLGDSPKFARPDYDDSEWEKIRVPATWQSDGFWQYHGYAWYRKTFDIDFDSKDELYLELGKIDDVDEVYLNGHRIGGTGGFPPDYYTAHNYPRRYLLPTEFLHKNKKNVLAVRVYDEGGQGGIVSGTVGIYTYRNYANNTFTLFGKWKFHLFDNPNWASEDFNDSDWDEILAPSSWEAQGFRNYDGFAWYRKTFVLPANFKTSDLMLLLGKIDDMDEVFINGELVGRTGKINRKWTDSNEWQRYRTYSIPEGLLKAGKKNVIAVRVYDQQGAGGIYEGPLTILPRDEYKLFWKKYRNDNFGFWEWLTFYFEN
jgi:hypothetical protein